MLLISFFDKDVINTLVPVYSLAPDTFFMLYDSKKCKVSRLENIKKAIAKRLPKTVVYPVECDVLDISSVEKVLSEIAAVNTGEEMYCDVAGGPELMTAAGCYYAKEMGITPLYIDLDNKVIFDVFERVKKFEMAPLSLQDYLTAVGAVHSSESHDTPDKHEFDRIVEMSEILFSKLSAWSNIQKYLAEQCSGRNDLSFVYDPREIRADKREDIAFVFAEFLRLGFIEQVSKIDYEFVNYKYKQYLTTYGIWLEMYTYIKAKECYDEVYLGFIIDWDKNDGENSNDNEIDVVVMDGYSPVFISCKTRKPEAKDVCEVGFLARRLGGDRAKSVLCTTHPVRETGDSMNSIYLRLLRFNVGLIEFKDFKKKTSKEIFEAAFVDAE